MSSEYLSLYFVLLKFKRSVRIYGETYAHKFCAVDIFFEYRPPSSNITCCQVPSPARAWFQDSAGDIDFYQMSLSQSESTILHDSLILLITLYN